MVCCGNARRAHKAVLEREECDIVGIEDLRLKPVVEGALREAQREVARSKGYRAVHDAAGDVDATDDQPSRRKEREALVVDGQSVQPRTTVDPDTFQHEVSV